MTSSVDVPAGPLVPQGLPRLVRWLRRVNPLVAALLRSPLHGLLSHELLLLQYEGRKSGRLFRVPLAYVNVGEDVVCATRQETSWWRNAVAASSVTVWFRGKRQVARAERLSGNSPETMAAFASFLTRNPVTARRLYHVRVVNGEPSSDDMAREIEASVVVRLRWG